MQGYTGCERKKDVSEIGEEGDDEGEDKNEDMRGVFFKIKQEDLHELEGDHEDKGVWCSRSMR